MKILQEGVYVGTELKLNIHIDQIGSNTMADYEWEVEAYCQRKKSVKIKKEDATKAGENDYVIKVDTGNTGTGVLKLMITAYIPDADFEDNLRTEVLCINTGIPIKPVLS